MLVQNGYGDIKVKIGNEEVTCIKSILMNGNETIKKLLLDEQSEGAFELFEKCEIKSFLEIEKYYSGGTMEIYQNNVCDILRFSIYYDDNRIMKVCKQYLMKHMHGEIVIEIFEILHNINNKCIEELKNAYEAYLMRKGYKYLNDGMYILCYIILDNLLLNTSIDCLRVILSSQRMIIKDENWLLDRLLKWYKNYKKSEDEEESEVKEQFDDILNKSINYSELKYDYISEENKMELPVIKIDLFKNKNIHIHIPIDEIDNEELIEIIKEYYVGEDEIKLNEDSIRMLKKRETREDLKILLNSNDIRIIEITVILVFEIGIYYVIPIKNRNELLISLLGEYNITKRNRTIYCICLFVNDKKSITTIEFICGKEILFKMLNNDNYLRYDLKNLLIKYIKKLYLDEEEEEEMNKIITNEEVLSRAKNIITEFYYRQTNYTFTVYKKILIIPLYNASECEFSIDPPLPDGIVINNETGVIHGKAENVSEMKEYEITCNNIKSEKKCKISLEFKEVKFTKLNKSESISISNDGKTITVEYSGNSWHNCYLDLKIVDGIYNIKYQFHQNGNIRDGVYLGLSTNNILSNFEKTTCNYYGSNGKSQDITSNCHIGTVVNKNPNFNNHGDGSIYEMIVDMNKREFWISHNDSKPVLLVKDLPSPLYPYVLLYYPHTSIELLSISHQN